MLLFLDFLTINDIVLRAKNKTYLYEVLGELSGRGPRSGEIYFKSGKIPPVTLQIMKTRMWQNGVTVSDEEIQSKADVAIGWKSFCEGAKRHNPHFLPKTISLLHALASKDIAFVLEAQKSPKEEVLAKYNKYLQETVLPLYLPQDPQFTNEISRAQNFSELRQPLMRVFAKGVIYLISHAEAEILSKYQNQSSLLVKSLPDKTSLQITLGQSFLYQRLQTYSLGENEYIQAMTDQFGDASDEKGLPELESYKKQYERYITKEFLPSWNMVKRIALMLREISIEGVLPRFYGRFKNA